MSLESYHKEVRRTDEGRTGDRTKIGRRTNEGRTKIVLKCIQLEQNSSRKPGKRMRSYSGK